MKGTKKGTSMSNRAATEITISAFTAEVRCPHCGHEHEGWIADPRGAKDVECEKCGKTFDIPEDTKVVLR